MAYDILAEEQLRLDEERAVVEAQITEITDKIASGDASVCAVAAGSFRSIGEMRLTALLKRREDLDTQRARLCVPESHPVASGVDEAGKDNSITTADTTDSDEVESE
jgi:hypothetical protein